MDKGAVCRQKMAIFHLCHHYSVSIVIVFFFLTLVALVSTKINTKSINLEIKEEEEEEEEIREDLLLILAELASLGLERENRSIHFGDFGLLHKQIPHLFLSDFYFIFLIFRIRERQLLDKNQAF